MLIVLCIIAVIIGLLLFIHNRPHSYPSILIPREEAVYLAGEHIRRLCGINVTDWRHYAMYWNDRETVNRLHRLDMLKRLRPVIYQWGLIESWRVRFVGSAGSVLVGINASGEVTFLHTDSGAAQASLLDKISGRSTAEEVRELLVVQGGSIWNEVKITGEGVREEDFSNLVTYWYTVESGEIRMRLSVQMQDRCIVRVFSEPEILTSDIKQVIRKEFRDSVFNLSGFVGSLLSVIVGVLLLIYTEGPSDSLFSLYIAILMFAAVLLTANDDIRMSIINSFDSRLKLKSVYLIGTLSAGVAGVAYGCVAFIASLAGFKLARGQELLILEQPLLQTLVGLAAGFFSLGLFAWMFNMLQSREALQISPELSDRSIFLSGFKLKQCLSISLQSSVLEEVIFRLMGVSTLLWLTDSNTVAILITSFLWAFLHQGSGYNPGWIRWSQLTVFGVILGFIYLRYGFLAVVTAHFVHNFVLLFMPLLYHKLDSNGTETPRTDMDGPIFVSGRKYGG